MGPDGHVHAKLVEQRFQAEHVNKGPTHSSERLRVGAIVVVLVAAVHRPMAVHDDPWTLGPIRWQIGLGQILAQPVELENQRLQAVVEKVVDLRADAHEVNGSQIEAVEQVIRASRHAEAGTIVREVAKTRTIRACSWEEPPPTTNWLLTTSPHDCRAPPCRADRQPPTRSAA